MPSPPEEEPPDGIERFSLVRGDRLFRIERAIGLIPPDGGLGVGRRAVLLALLTWLPIVVWASVTGRALPPGRVSEPLLEHFGVHVRCLVAIPLFILAEATAHAMSVQLVPYFVTSGLVPSQERARFAAAVQRTRALRDRSLPLILIAGLVIGWLVARPIQADLHELEWGGIGKSCGSRILRRALRPLRSLPLLHQNSVGCEPLHRYTIGPAVGDGHQEPQESRRDVLV